jgi:hypothetical protein
MRAAMYVLLGIVLGGLLSLWGLLELLRWIVSR